MSVKRIGAFLFKKFPVLKKIYIAFRIKIVKIKRIPNEYKTFKKFKRKINDTKGVNKVIYYLGYPEHANLGDLAQGYCIRLWLKKSFPDYKVCEISTSSLVDTHFSVLSVLCKAFNETDLIVFQSGYTTTDLGGYADYMHRKVVKHLPEARMLMMPQTIFFKKEKNKNKTSRILNSMKNSMLFLARDNVSYEEACRMFPDVNVRAYPDIVTSLIGKMAFENERNGILFCCRDDEERFYSEEEMDKLIDSLAQFCKVDKTDTTIKGAPEDIISNSEYYIKSEIEKYSHYNVIITDRYHGTIFSLISNTPVIVVKTTDHKVVTGLDWFKGIYDGYFYYADTLEKAGEIAKSIYNKPFQHKLQPYFDEKYYSELGAIFLSETKNR